MDGNNFDLDFYFNIQNFEDLENNLSSNNSFNSHFSFEFEKEIKNEEIFKEDILPVNATEDGKLTEEIK